MEIDADHHVIATGGSVVYSEPGMMHLKNGGKIVFLNLPCKKLLKRIGDIETRGVVLPASQTFLDMYNERLPLYKRYADFVLECNNLNHQQVVDQIVRFVNK